MRRIACAALAGWREWRCWRRSEIRLKKKEIQVVQGKPWLSLIFSPGTKLSQWWKRTMRIAEDDLISDINNIFHPDKSPVGVAPCCCKLISATRNGECSAVHCNEMRRSSCHASKTVPETTIRSRCLHLLQISNLFDERLSDDGKCGWGMEHRNKDMRAE